MSHHNDPITLDDARALRTLDSHYATSLGFSAADLRRPGWTIVAARKEWDPMALLFGQRPLLTVIAPITTVTSITTAAPSASRALTSDPLAAAASPLPHPAGRPGVAVVAPEIRVPVAALLHELTPDTLFSPVGLRALDHLMTYAAPDHVSAPSEIHVHIRYATPAGFQRYLGVWQDWIEPLDESRETDPLALSLLARYSGGVYVVRQEGAIASFAGIRTHSPHVSEIGVRTDTEAMRGHGLASAVVSRATRAVFAAERLPIYRHHAANDPSMRVAERLGYRLYAESLTYLGIAR